MRQFRPYVLERWDIPELLEEMKQRQGRTTVAICHSQQCTSYYRDALGSDHSLNLSYQDTLGVLKPNQKLDMCPDCHHALTYETLGYKKIMRLVDKTEKIEVAKVKKAEWIATEQERLKCLAEKERIAALKREERYQKKLKRINEIEQRKLLQEQKFQERKLKKQEKELQKLYKIINRITGKFKNLTKEQEEKFQHHPGPKVKVFVHGRLIWVPQKLTED